MKKFSKFVEEVGELEEAGSKYGPGHIGAIQRMLDKEREEQKRKKAAKKNESAELDEAETKYVIKHKKTKEVLSTHDDYDAAKDEHTGLGGDKKNYGVYKQTKKDAALHNRNTYREQNDTTMGSITVKSDAERKKRADMYRKKQAMKKNKS